MKLLQRACVSLTDNECIHMIKYEFILQDVSVHFGTSGVTTTITGDRLPLTGTFTDKDSAAWYLFVSVLMASKHTIMSKPPLYATLISPQYLRDRMNDTSELAFHQYIITAVLQN